MNLLPALPPEVEGGKIFPWASERLIRRTCPVCGVDSSESICIRPDTLSINQCNECGLIYLPDVPRAEDLQSFYDAYTENKEYDELSPNTMPLSFITKLRLARAHFGIQILNSFGGLHGYNICEIGCSYGLFLQLARFCHANGVGVELDQKARRSVIKNLDLPVVSDISDIEIEQDIFCAFSVFEHLIDPNAVLQQIHKKCVNDGRLLLSMPNGGNFENIGPIWAGFRVDLEHVNYFNLKNLSKLLSNNGFFVEQHWFLNQLCTNRVNVKPTVNSLLSKLLFNYPKFIRSGSATVVVLARKV